MLVPVSPLVLADTVTVPARIPVSRPFEFIEPLPTVSSTDHTKTAPGTSFPFTSRWTALNWRVLPLAIVGLLPEFGVTSIETGTPGITMTILFPTLSFEEASTVTAPATNPVSRPV